MVVWLNAPDVPVMVIVLVPLGVPLLPPVFGRPLQPARASTPMKAKPQASFLAPRRAAALAIRSTRTKLMIPRTPTGGNRRNEGRLGGIMATVVRLPVEVFLPALGGVTLAGVRVHVEFSGSPVQVRATADEKLFCEVTVTVKAPFAPPVTLTEEGVTARVKSGWEVPDPVPESATVWGDPEAPVKATSRVAVSEPLVVGVKTRSMVQLAPAASVPLGTQVEPAICCEKSEALVPVKVIAIPVTPDLVLLISETV